MARDTKGTSWFAALGLALALGAPASAAAQTPEELFAEGKRAMEAQDYAAACPAFRRSFDASDSKGALYNLALCEDEGRAGRLATSLSLWRQVAARFEGQAEVAAEAQRRIAALEAKVARIRIRPAAGAPRDLEIALDGAAAAVDEAIPVDAGGHSITATAPGRAAQRVQVTVADGENRVVEIDAGGTLSVADEASKEPRGPTAPPRRDAPERSDSGLTTAGYVVGGIGLTGLALFAISAPIIAGAESDLDEACPSRAGCGPEAAEAADRGEAWLVPNAVGLGVGVLGVGLGVTFLILGAEGDGVAATARPDGLELRGRF